MIRANRTGQRYAEVFKFVERTFERDLHAKRIGSLADATYGS
jgi:hypothetical protein